jgi:hypothetical protein
MLCRRAPTRKTGHSRISKPLGKIGRMRVLSSPKVLASAEQIGQKITNMYLEPNKTFFELRDMINKNAIDILGDFGEACREEFRSLRMETA